MLKISGKNDLLITKMIFLILCVGKSVCPSTFEKFDHKSIVYNKGQLLDISPTTPR